MSNHFKARLQRLFANVRVSLSSVAVGGVLSAMAVASAVSCSAPDETETGSVQQAATTVTVSFQNGVSPSASYSGTTDSTLKQASPSSNFGGDAKCDADGDDGGGVDKSCVVRWSLTSIPAGSVVQSVSVTFRVVNGTTNTYSIYGLLRSWDESQVTWQSATTSNAWATAGAMGSTDRGSVVGSISGSTGTRVVNLNSAGVALVQSWVDGGTNAGIIVASTSNSNGIDLASSEHSTVSYHPILTITYEPPGGGGGSGGAPGSGGAGSGTGGASPGGSGAEVSTDPNLKVAFVGDTATGSGFTSVLNLVKNEGTDALIVEGDMSYSADPAAWWSVVESVLGTTFPVFISRGNHDDSSWSGYLPKAASHLGGATRVAGAHDANYKTTYRGLVIATIRKGDSPANITPFLDGDPHIWKICQWHQNQQAMQIGGKSNEMGWDVYEACRERGAIIETGHEHSYSRTKSLTSMSSQIVDPGCSSPTSLCLGPGRTFANVVGLGGNSVRSQSRCLPSAYPYGCNGEWAFIYTSNQGATHGAQFITFNAGNPKVATGYFKNVNNQVVDTFTITHD